jgi:hypothetical protein
MSTPDPYDQLLDDLARVFATAALDKLLADGATEAIENDQSRGIRNAQRSTEQRAVASLT